MLDVEAEDDILLYGDSGKDGIYLFKSTAGDVALLDGGTNDDRLFANEVVSEDLRIFGRSGADYVNAQNTWTSDRLHIDLGSGDDWMYRNMNFADRYLFDFGS